jgi:dGTPase
VTQVVAPDEGHVFHNRLTHSMKVGQIARRIAEGVTARFSHTARFPAGTPVLPDPDVAEAAGFAHDLGHPPFGHVAEKILDELVVEHGLADGYEGNAQTLRILTKLAIRTGQHLGLDLTRKTLAAVLKYPWYRAAEKGTALIARDGEEIDKFKKWGAYITERPEFEFCRVGLPPDERSIEAQCMELADDIAYSIHDAEDFYRAGLVPLDRLAPETGDERTAEAQRFLRRACERLKADGSRKEKLGLAFDAAMRACALDESYRGTYHHRANLRAWASDQIQDLINGIEVTVTDGGVDLSLPESLQHRIEILKELTWAYVILSPRLATQQVGYSKIIRDLFEDYLGAAKDAKKRHVLPARFGDQPQGTFEALYGDLTPEQRHVRLVADIISSMTDGEALTMHRRLRGVAPGSVRDGVF